MGHEERSETKGGGEKERREDTALSVEALRYLPSVLRMLFVLHSAARNSGHNASVEAEPSKGVSNGK